MASPLVGVWELVSETNKSLWIFTETYHAGAIVRQGVRQGIAGPYTLEGTHFHSALFISVVADVTTTDQDIHREGDLFTTKMLTPGTLVPTGQEFVYCKISDVAMTSPFAGVWQLVSETDKAIITFTDTHWVTVVNRGDFRRGFGGTHTVEGNRVNNTILLDTATNTPSRFDVECHREGDILIIKRLAETTNRMPSGYTDQWRKIG
jgi:hypothetical protein